MNPKEIEQFIARNPCSIVQHVPGGLHRFEHPFHPWPQEVRLHADHKAA